MKAFFVRRALTFSFLLFTVQAIAADLSYTVPALTEQPTDVVAVEGERVALRCRGTSSLPAVHSWYKNNEEVTADADNYEKTADGDLVIQSYNPQVDNAVFFCLLRVAAGGIELKLKSREASVQTAVEQKEFKRDIEAATGFDGGVIRLSVDATNIVPFPQIGWNYRGKPSITSDDPRFTALPQGVLQISNLKAEDSGEIRVVARLRSSGSANLIYGNYRKLQVLPGAQRPADKGFYFIGKPRDVDLQWGQSTILEACVDSAGPAAFSWYKDGVAIQLGASKSIVGEGNLKILYAKDEDSGVYKVVVQSAGQTLEASATLNVVSAPSFSQVPEQRITAEENSVVTFRYKVLGGAKLAKRWYHDGVLINAAADYTEFGDDYLTIKDIIQADAGMYQLYASNSVGEAQLSLELVVVSASPGTFAPVTQKPILGPGKPRNVQAYPRSETEIDVSWQEPLVTNGQLTNYQIIYFSSLDSALTVKVGPTERFATIRNLLPGTSYKFRVQASNADTPGPLSDTVTAATNPSSVYPAQVESVNFKVMADGLSVTWALPASGAAATKYVVSYVNAQTPSKTPQTVESTELSAFLKPLDPGVNYRFWITPYNGINKGPKSLDYYAQIPGGAPATPGQILDLTVASVSSTVAFVEWKASDSDPRPDSYLIYFDNLKDPSPSPYSVNSSQVKSYVQNLKPFTTYEFWVVPYSGLVSGPPSRKVQVILPEDKPEAVQNVQIVSIANDRIKIRWDPIPLSERNGVLTSYRAQIYERGRKTETLKYVENIKPTQTEIVIMELSAEANYFVAVQGATSVGYGSFSANLAVTTRRATSTGPTPPAKFAVVQNPDYPDVISVTWSDPLYVTGDVKNYYLYYKKLADSEWTKVIVPGTVTSVDLNTFVFGETYVAYVTAVDGNGAGTQSKTETIATLFEISSPDSPLQLAVETTADSLTATWAPPSGNFVVRGYDVSVRNRDSGNVIYNQKSLGRHNTMLKLYNGIDSSSAYRVTVQAFNNIGTSPPIVKTASTLPAPKPAILLHSVIERSYEVFFNWTDSGDKSAGPVVYVVRYIVFDNDGNTVVKQEVVSGKTEFTAENLTPFTVYNFFVKRQSDAAFGKFPTVETKTLETVASAPLDLTALTDEKHSSWIYLSWQVPKFPNGKILSYVVLFNADSSMPIAKWPEIKTKSASMFYNITGLTPDTTYFLSVYAINGAGSGASAVPISKSTGGGVLLPPVKGGTGGTVIGVVGPPSDNGARLHGSARHSGFELWWLLLILLALIILILLILLCIYCCCCRKKGWCFGCCPCCERLCLCCCLPCLLWCCPCCPCCKKLRKVKDKKLYVSAPATLLVEKSEKNGAALKGSSAGMWLGADKIELMPLTAGEADRASGPSTASGKVSPRSLSHHTSKDSVAQPRVPVPGDSTFISYKTSLQDYCQKVGWLPPVYQTQQYQSGFSSKVSFAGSVYASGSEFGSSRQDAEQRAAFVALLGLGVMGMGSTYNSEAGVAVPSPGDPSFISYKCSLHDLCQQCNILPPRFTTTIHDNGVASQAQVGSHAFNMPGRVHSSREAEQKVACIALQGLCMMASDATYQPSACFTVPGPGDSSFVSFKSSLHDFCQRYKLPPPQYITNQTSQGFSAKLKFGGLFFQSSNHFSSRLEAEQHAAFEALQGLGLLESYVKFESQFEADRHGRPSSRLSHGSGVITVGTVGGGDSGTGFGSRHGSRHGSASNLYQFPEPLLPPAPSRSPAPGIGARSYSSGSGFSGHRSPAADFTHAGGSETLGRGATFSNGYGNTKAGSKYDLASSSNSIHRSSSHNVSAVPGYGLIAPAGDATDLNGHFRHSPDINESYTTSYKTSGKDGTITVSQSGTGMPLLPAPVFISTPAIKRAASLDRGYESDSPMSSTFSYSMSYEHRSTNRAANTLGPVRRQQHSRPALGRGYGSTTHMADYGMDRGVRSSSHPALADIEREMAGLQGLIRDLNGITATEQQKLV